MCEAIPLVDGQLAAVDLGRAMSSSSVWGLLYNCPTLVGVVVVAGTARCFPFRVEEAPWSCRHQLEPLGRRGRPGLVRRRRPLSIHPLRELLFPLLELAPPLRI